MMKLTNSTVTVSSTSVTKLALVTFGLVGLYTA